MSRMVWFFDRFTVSKMCNIPLRNYLGACFLLVSTSDTAYKYESMASFSSFKGDLNMQILLYNFNGHSVLIKHDGCYIWGRNYLPFGSTPRFEWGSCCSIFSFLSIVLYIIVWYFFYGHCLSFDLRLLVTPLIPSNFPCTSFTDRRSSRPTVNSINLIKLHTYR